MSGKTRPSQRAKVLSNVDYSNLSYTDKHFIHDMFALVESQQAEIERSRENNKAIMQTIADVHTEAIKEFAKRYKNLLETELHWCECADEIIKPLDNLVKEMVGDDK
jgi:hypothetical protein